MNVLDVAKKYGVLGVTHVMAVPLGGALKEKARQDQN